MNKVKTIDGETLWLTDHACIALLAARTPKHADMAFDTFAKHIHADDRYWIWMTIEPYHNDHPIKIVRAGVARCLVKYLDIFLNLPDTPPTYTGKVLNPTRQFYINRGDIVYK